MVGWGSLKRCLAWRMGLPFALCLAGNLLAAGCYRYYRVLQDFAAVMRYGAATAGCHLGCSDVRRFLSESRRRAIGGLWWGVCEWGA